MGVRNLVHCRNNCKLLVEGELVTLAGIAVDKEGLHTAAELPFDHVMEILPVNLAISREGCADFGDNALNEMTHRVLLISTLG